MTKRENPQILDTKEAAAYLKMVSYHSLIRWRCLGKGPKYIRMNKKVGYLVEDLQKFVEDCLESPDKSFKV